MRKACRRQNSFDSPPEIGGESGVPIGSLVGIFCINKLVCQKSDVFRVGNLSRAFPHTETIGPSFAPVEFCGDKNMPVAPTYPAPEYRMPAEWEPHLSTWIAWPHQRSDWPGKIAPIPWVYAEIVRHLHTHEIVNILINNATAQKRAMRILQRAMVDLSQVRFWQLPTDRVWVRDFGPIFLVGSNGKKAFLDWQFTGWAKYPNCKKDDAVPAKLAKSLKLPSWRPIWNDKRVVLEGGSIDVNGQGLLLTTEECLLSDVQARNPGLSRTDLENL